MSKSEQIASLFAAVGFKIDQRSIQSLNKSLGTIEARVNKIRQSISGVKAGKNYGDAFKGLERQATGAATAIDGITKKYKSGLGPLQSYTTATQSLAAAMAQLRNVTPARMPRMPSGGGAGGAGGGRRRGQQGFWAGAFGGLFGGGASTFARGIIPGLGAGWAVAHAVTNARKGIATENALSALTGSQGGGRQEYQYVKDFSNKYGLKAGESADGYKRILASSVGTKLQGNGAKNIFEGVSLYGKTLGLGNEEMSRASTAISQMISKGKISSEELKGQLAESLPGAVQIFARAMDVPVSQMFKMMENGEVLAEDVLPKVAELLKIQAAAGGALEKSMKSSLSAQNRFLNKWEDFLKRVFEGGLDSSLAQFFQSLTFSLERLEPALIAVTKLIGFFVTAIGGLVKLFQLLPGPLQATLVGFGALKVLLATGAWAWLKTHPLVVFLTLLALVLEDFYVWTQGGDSLFGDLFGAWKPEYLDPFFKAFDAWVETLKEAKQLVMDILALFGMGEKGPKKPGMANVGSTSRRVGNLVKNVPGVGGGLGLGLDAFGKAMEFLQTKEGASFAKDATQRAGAAVLPAPVTFIINGVTDPEAVAQVVDERFRNYIYRSKTSVVETDR